MNEIWRPVVGHEGRYEVSDMGRVRSVDRSFFRGPTPLFPNGCTIKWRGKILAPGDNGTGHLVVALGRRSMAQVHRLVLEAFVGPCPPDHECAHWDDVPANNRLSNLRWATRSDNMKDACRNGKHGRSKLHSNIRLGVAGSLGEFAVKARNPERCGTFKFVTVRGGLDGLRVNAARFRDSATAQATVELNLQSHPGWEWKVIQL